MRSLRESVRLVPLLFLGAIALGALALSLPFATSSGVRAPLVTAVFTAASAVSVTGLAVVDTGTFWSPFGQVAILLMIQIGGFGIMTAATVFGLVMGRGFGLKDRIATGVERARLDLGDVRSVMGLVFWVTLAVEASIAALLFLRLAIFYDMGWGAALWHGGFHAVSAFNNAGFSTFATGLMGFQSDPAMLGGIMLAVFLGALGFPVMQDLRIRGLGWRRYSLHTKITLTGTAGLLAFGFVATLAMEWNNPGTLGPLGWPAKLLNSAFHAVMPRTAGFNSLDVGAFRDETLLINFFLMFVGGGSAGTAGGIKVTTFMVLLALVMTEIARRQDSGLFRRRFGAGVGRQALAIFLISGALVFAGTILLTMTSAVALRDALFESISAFATVGLSTGITADLPAAGQLVLVALMFIGRVGSITIATALAAGLPPRPWRYPEESPIVG